MIIDHTPHIQEFDLQGRYNSCVWMTIAAYLRMVWHMLTGEWVEFSAAFGWQGQKGDNDNEGVIPSVAFYFLKKTGICLESTYPYTDENLNRQPPPEAFKEAKSYRIGASVIIKTADEALKYLAKFPLFCSFKFRGVNHAMLAVGYSDEGGVIRWRILNWWNGLTLFWMDDAEFRVSFKQAVAVTRLPVATWAVKSMAKAFNKLLKMFR